MEAANGDPLRAQEIENELTQEWWERWRADRSAKIKAQEAKKHG